MDVHSLSALLLRHGDADIFDFIHGVSEGEPLMIAVALFLLGFIVFGAVQHTLGGKSFVKSRKERRRARERCQRVLWKYESDD